MPELDLKAFPHAPLAGRKDDRKRCKHEKANDWPANTCLVATCSDVVINLSRFEEKKSREK